MKLLGVQFYRLLKYDRPLAVKEIKDKANLVYRELNKEDLPKFENLLSKDKIPIMEQRLDQGEMCWGGFDGEKLVAIGWATPKEVYEEKTGIRIPIKPGEIYGYHLLTHPDYRNLGIGTAIILTRDAALLERGFQKNVGFVDIRNIPSRRSSQKKGSQIVGIYYVLIWRGKSIKFYRPLSNPSKYELKQK